jgi:glutaminase
MALIYEDKAFKFESHFLSEVYELTCLERCRGKVADYIPALAHINPNQFGIAVRFLDGRQFSFGHADTPFSLQSITKVFSFAMALNSVGDDIWQRIGREPSGAAFNSIIQLESENGRPRNPFINAGALVVADVLTSRYVDYDYALLGTLRRICGDETMRWNTTVANSERGCAYRNLALAYFMKSQDNFHNNPQTVLDKYCNQCAIEMTCNQLALAAIQLADTDGSYSSAYGVQDRFIGSEVARKITSLMLTCGAYDASGDFAYRIGIPVKTGVGGGIVAVVPNVCAIVVWSPELDAKGNSVWGALALETLIARMRKSK